MRGHHRTTTAITDTCKAVTDRLMETGKKTAGWYAGAVAARSVQRLLTAPGETTRGRRASPSGSIFPATGAAHCNGPPRHSPNHDCRWVAGGGVVTTGDGDDGRRRRCGGNG